MVRRILKMDWRTWVAFGFAVMVVFVVVDRERLANANETIAADAVLNSDRAARQRAELLAGQADLQKQINRLVTQNAALVRILQTQGVDVPASLIAGRTTRIETGDDDDDDPDTIIVRPDDDPDPSSSPSNSTPSEDTPNVDLPEVPMPPNAGQATDTAKRITEDLTGIDVQ